MKLVRLITLAAALIVPLHAHAQIEGAFGLKLGDVLDVDSDAVEAVEDFEITIYRIKPPRPLTGFDAYLVYTTPLTHKIYQIKAFHRFKLVDAAKKEYRLLGKVLKSKYEKEAEKNLSKPRPPRADVAGKETTIERGGNSVSIRYYGPKNIAKIDRITDEYIYPRVVITYRNKDDELRDEEFRTIYQNRQEEGASGNKLAEEAESVL